MADFKISTQIAAIDKMTGPVRRMAGKVGQSFASIGRAAGKAALRMGALTGAAAVAGGAAALKLADSYSQAADELAKFARRAGVSVESYQEIRHAAELAGVSHEEWRRAVEKFTRTMGDTKAGTGALVGLLKRTSPELLKMLEGTESNEQALDLMLSAMGKLEDPTKRAALAAAAFGKAGQRMTLLLEGGEEGLRAAREEAHKLGLVISTEAATAAESYVDSMTRLKRSLGGVAASIGQELLPEIQPAVDSMVEWMAANRGVIRQRMHDTFRGIGGGIRWARNQLDDLTDALAPYLSRAEAFIEGNGGIGRIGRDFIDGVGLAADQSEVIQAAREGLFDGLVAAEKAALALLAEVSPENARARNLSDPDGTQRRKSNNVLDAFDDAANQLTDLVYNPKNALSSLLDSVRPQGGIFAEVKGKSFPSFTDAQRAANERAAARSSVPFGVWSNHHEAPLRVGGYIETQNALSGRATPMSTVAEAFAPFADQIAAATRDAEVAVRVEVTAKDGASARVRSVERTGAAGRTTVNTGRRSVGAAGGL